MFSSFRPLHILFLLLFLEGKLLDTLPPDKLGEEEDPELSRRHGKHPGTPRMGRAVVLGGMCFLEVTFFLWLGRCPTSGLSS